MLDGFEGVPRTAAHGAVKRLPAGDVRHHATNHVVKPNNYARQTRARLHPEHHSVRGRLQCRRHAFPAHLVVRAGDISIDSDRAPTRLPCPLLMGTETPGHLHDWTKDKASNLHLSQIGLPDLELVDLQSQVLQAAGLEVWELFGTSKPDYSRTLKWAVHIWQSVPNANGLLWRSRRENECAVMMLFGDRIPPGTVRAADTPKPIAEFEHGALRIPDRLGCGISWLDTRDRHDRTPASSNVHRSSRPASGGNNSVTWRFAWSRNCASVPPS